MLQRYRGNYETTFELEFTRVTFENENSFEGNVSLAGYTIYLNEQW